MGVLDIAKQEAKRLKDEKEKQDRQRKRENEVQESIRCHLEKGINDALDEFDGVKGIKRQGSALYKKGKRIAWLELRWETWNNPNVDYEEEESGLVARYQVEGNKPDDRGQTGSHLDDFGRAMARYL